VVVAVLPEQANLRNELALSPAFVVILQVRQEGLHQRVIGMNLVCCPEAVRNPAPVPARLRARRPEPIAGIVPRVTRFVQPAHFVELMSCRTTDRAIGPAPERPVDKLGETVAAVGRPISKMF